MLLQANEPKKRIVPLLGKQPYTTKPDSAPTTKRSKEEDSAPTGQTTLYYKTRIVSHWANDSILLDKDCVPPD